MGMAAVTRYRKCAQLVQRLRYISSAITYSHCRRGILSTTTYGDRRKQNAKELPRYAKTLACHRFTRGFKYATGFSALAPKSLNSIIDVDKAKDASPEELSSMWNEVLPQAAPLSPKRFHVLYHLGRGHISAVMTGLEDYKARGTQASPYFTVTYYKEFAEDKGLVLVRGDIVFTSKLSDEEASWLLETAQSFYLNDTRYKLVEQFNRETRDFEFKDVLQALDMPLG